MVRPRWTLQLDLRQLRRLLRLRLAHLFWDSKPRQMFLCRRLEVLFLGGQDDTPCALREQAQLPKLYLPTQLRQSPKFSSFPLKNLKFPSHTGQITRTMRSPITVDATKSLDDGQAGGRLNPSFQGKMRKEKP